MTDHLISPLFGTARHKKKQLLQGGSQPATSRSHACVSLRRSNEKKKDEASRSVTRNGPTTPWAVKISCMVIGRFMIWDLEFLEFWGFPIMVMDLRRGDPYRAGGDIRTVVHTYYVLSYEVNDTSLHYCKSQSKINNILLRFLLLDAEVIHTKTAH